MEYEPWLDLFNSGNYDGVAHVHAHEDSWIRLGDVEFSFDTDIFLLDDEDPDGTIR